MDNQAIQNRIQLLDPDYREFVLGDFPEMTATVFGESLGLNEDQIIVFENGLAFWLLFFLSRDQLVDFLIKECGVDADSAQTVVTTIIAGLPEELSGLMKKAFAEISDGAETPSDTNLASEIAETQAELDALQPIHTMSDDVAAAQGEEPPVHQSSQEHIFGQRPVLGETPSYQPEKPAAATPPAQTSTPPTSTPPPAPESETPPAPADAPGRWDSEKQ